MTRKKLTDTEANYLAGSTPVPKTETPTKNTSTTTDTMSQILAPADSDKETVTRFTADLPDSLHERLSIAAIKAKKSKVQLVREILAAVLPQ
jgi:predicted HicB family RNase H-like nuclease